MLIIKTYFQPAKFLLALEKALQSCVILAYRHVFLFHIMSAQSTINLLISFPYSLCTCSRIIAVVVFF